MSKEDLHAAAAPVYEQESVPEPEPVYEAPVYDAPLQNQDDAFFDSLDAAGDVSNVPEGSVFDAEAMPQAQPIDFREENFEDLSQPQELNFDEETEEIQELTDFGDLADIEEIPQAQTDPIYDTRGYACRKSRQRKIWAILSALILRHSIRRQTVCRILW